MDAKEKRTRERESERERRGMRKKREEERNHGVGGRTCTHYLSSHILEKSQAIRTYASIHCAVANFLLHFNV